MHTFDSVGVEFWTEEDVNQLAVWPPEGRTLSCIRSSTRTVLSFDVTSSFKAIATGSSFMSMLLMSLDSVSDRFWTALFKDSTYDFGTSTPPSHK